MKVIDSLKRKSRLVGVAGVAVCGAVVLTCYGYGLVPPVQGQAERAEAVQAETAQGVTAEPVRARYGKDGLNVNYEKQLAVLRQSEVSIGETLAIDSGAFRVPSNKGDDGRNYNWDGTMEFSVLSVDIYDSIDDAPIGKGQVNGFANRDVARDYEKDGGCFLLYKMRVHNVDAEPAGGKYLLSTSLEPDGEVGAADPFYLDCTDAGAIDPKKPEYVRVAKGKTRTFTCGWAVLPGRGASTAERLDFDSEGLNSVSLAGAVDHRSR